MAEEKIEAVESTEETKKDNKAVSFVKGIPGAAKKHAKEILIGAATTAAAVAGGALLFKRITDGDFEAPLEITPDEGAPEEI